MQIIEEVRKAVPPGKMIEYCLASHSVIDECFRKMIDALDNTRIPKGKNISGMNCSEDMTVMS